MKLFGKTSSAEMDPATLLKEVENTQKRLVMFQETIQDMFVFLQEYTMEIDEIDSAAFKERLKTLQEKFQSLERPAGAVDRFGRQKESILKYIQRQKTYIKEREKEFREIIDLMTAAMSGMNDENRDFYTSIRTQGEHLEQITLLDDIKRIKQDLYQEVEKLQSLVRRKEEQDQNALEALSSQVDVLKRELDKALQSANTDGLTGVYNRKALDGYLLSLVDRNRVSRQPFSLLMMDLDHFKKLNDTYGHTTGDRMLVAFADKCRQSVRSDDFVARYGGEEFTVILPGASLRNALKKAKLICKTIAGSRYAADDSPNPEAISVTVSIGVSAYQKGDTAQSIIERADNCLYKAKKNGRNRAIGENEL